MIRQVGFRTQVGFWRRLNFGVLRSVRTDYVRTNELHPDPGLQTTGDSASAFGCFMHFFAAASRPQKNVTDV